MIKELKNRKWEVLSSQRIINKGPWMNVRQEAVKLPSGVVVPEWFIFDFPSWINVIAVTKDGHIVMEDQYRHGIGRTCFELPAGVIDPGETPLEAARRELFEETGYGNGDWEEFMVISPNPTNHSNLNYCFLATGVEKISDQHLEKSEDIEVDILSKEEVKQLLCEGKIIQALHAAPLWKYFALENSK